jgi:hypothetical protein
MSGSMDLELARRIVERHALRPGRWVEGVHAEPAGVVVETDTLPWVVRPAALGAPGFDVYEIVRGYHIDPPPAPVGVAVAPDGESFELNDEDGFRSFWAGGGRALDAATLAALMAAYLSGEYRGRVLDASEVDGCEPLDAEESDGRLRFRFCSSSTVPDETGEDRVVVLRWDVDGERDGPLRWSTTELD